MMGLCLGMVAGVATAYVALPAETFELRWSQKRPNAEWREEWRATPTGLVGIRARVHAQGAGLEPPAFARLENGWHVWPLPPVTAPRLTLARSDSLSNHRLCVGGECRDLAHYVGGTGPVTLESCHAR